MLLDIFTFFIVMYSIYTPVIIISLLIVFVFCFFVLIPYLFLSRMHSGYHTRVIAHTHSHLVNCRPCRCGCPYPRLNQPTIPSILFLVHTAQSHSFALIIQLGNSGGVGTMLGYQGKEGDGKLVIVDEEGFLGPGGGGLAAVKKEGF